MKLFKARFGNIRKSALTIGIVFLLLLIATHGDKPPDNPDKFAQLLMFLMGSLMGIIGGWSIYYQIFSEHGDWWLTYQSGFDVFIGANTIILVYFTVIATALLIKIPWLPKWSLMYMLAATEIGKCLSLIAARVTWEMDNAIRSGAFILIIIAASQGFAFVSTSINPTWVILALLGAITIELIILVGGEPRWLRLQD